jgi:energy-converting hydrogenase Eha subunit E
VNAIAYRSAATKCTGKAIRQSINLKLPTVLLFVEYNSTMALAILTQQVILSVQVFVKAVGVKLLKLFSTEITVF